MRKSPKVAGLTGLTLVIALTILGCFSPARPQQEERTLSTRQEEKLLSTPREESPPQIPAPTPVSPSMQSTPSTTIKSPTGGITQSSSEGAVTIDIKWMGPKNSSLVFDVVMDTHSVDLNRFDLEKLALLRDDEGKEYAASSWNSPPGSHHRRGALSFPLPDSLAQGKTKFLQLIIRDIAGVKERVLKWELG